MKLTGKDLRKAVAFLSAVVLVAVCMMVAGAKPSPTAPPGQAGPQPAPAAAAKPSAETPAAKAPAPATEPGRADPRPAPTLSAAERPTAPSPAFARGSLPPLPGSLPPLGTSPAGVWGGPPPSRLWLAGVIQGQAKLALLRRGENRYLVKEGDSVEGSYRVAKITANSVTLQGRHRALTLRVGQY